jgi:hypothetical protein
MAEKRDPSPKDLAKIFISKSHGSIYECLTQLCYSTPDTLKAREAIAHAFDLSVRAVETSFVGRALSPEPSQLDFFN